MKTFIYALLITMALACGEAGMQPLDQGQPMADGAPDVAAPDAMQPAIDAAPEMPEDAEYPCFDMPRIDSYDAQGRIFQRAVYRYADVSGAGSDQYVIVCNTESAPYYYQSLHGGILCDGVMVSCAVESEAWPKRQCHVATPMVTDDGRYLVMCGIRSERDRDFDGVFEEVGEWSQSVHAVTR